MKQLRIACFSAHYPPKPDAEGYVTAKWVNALRQAGHEIEVFHDPGRKSSGNKLARAGEILLGLLARFPQARRHETLDLTQLEELTDYVGRSLTSFLSRHAKTRFDIIVSRYEPIGSAIAAYWAHAETQLPWVASYNDPLPRIAARRHGPMGHWDQHRNSFQLRWLGRLLLTPTWRVFPSERMRRSIVETAPSVGIVAAELHNRSSVVPHVGGPLAYGGVCCAMTPVDTKQRDPHQNGDCLLIRHLGYLSALRDPTTVLEALALWEQIPETPPLRVEFIGNNSSQADRLNEFAGRGMMKVHLGLRPEVDLDTSFALMCQADVCLLIEQPASESVFLPSKFCDYAAAGRPILAITAPDGTVQDYLRKYGGGIAVVHGDVPGTVRALRTLTLQREVPCSGLAEEFKPARIARAWEEVLQRCEQGN